MPSPERTFYNLKRLHVVFAISSLALLAVTVWMIAADHWREWKGYQRTFRDQVEPWFTQSAIRQKESGGSAGREDLERTLAQQSPNAGKSLLRMPFVDAFGRPLAIDQVWLPDLTVNYNFRQVARFDRCTTCHLGIDKAELGATQTPAYRPQKVLQIELPTPNAAPKRDPGSNTNSIEAVYGFSVAPHGVLDPGEVTVDVVKAKTAAAQADLYPGDVILQANGQPIDSESDLERVLLQEVSWGKPAALKVRRGLPHPFQSHPRLDLFVGAESPHPMPEFGCTICHDGQGSATEFKFASHSPNLPAEGAGWRKEHGWFWNPDWDLPMRPARFVESNCLKCHHDVSDLEPNSRFPDPPTAKLVAGYHLVRENGCFGCHEIKGVTNSGERIGPDMRLEPNYHEMALALLADPGLTKDEQLLARQLAAQPENEEVRRQLAVLLGIDSKRADVAKLKQLTRHSQAIAAQLANHAATPGTMRKVGPSLRGMAGKLDAAFANAWLARPASFRPETRMPQFFGMHEHLEGKGLDEARRFESVEIHAINAYLLAASQSVPLQDAPKEVTEPPSAERGKRLFQTQGCLACHKHAEFPTAQAAQGPDLSRLGAKLTTEAGKKWLVSWIRNPLHHSPRTLMPNPLLQPNPLPADDADAKAKDAKAPAGRARIADPAADIAAYLLSNADWQTTPLAPLVETDLDALALLYLKKAYPAETAEEYLRQGIPALMADEVQGDAEELIGPITPEKKIRYVGRQTIRKRGCYGCHDIPGFEMSQLIGPALSDWGRKQQSLLAFEQVHQFVVKTEGVPDERREDARGVQAESDSAYYRDALRSGRREGFLWQKLRAPRSFDYQKTDSKGYNEKLLMGRFTLTDAQREAIMTFVLGLVAEPPKEKYLHRPDRRAKAIVEGRKVLDKYGCARCHTLEMERWTIAVDAARFPSPPGAADYPFLKPQVSTEQLAASLVPDRRGLVHADLVGMPQWNAEGKPEESEDEDGNPVNAFVPWEPAVVAGKIWPVGGPSILVSPKQVLSKRPATGGDFARLLYPIAIEEGKKAGSTATVVEAWGWVPPALVHEGQIVQPAWLYKYLLEPTVIRPASVLRMPKFNLSPGEAGKLVDYFAAISSAEFPYTATARPGNLTANDNDSKPMEKAFRLMTDRKTYCAKCHLIGDFGPGGENRTILAPNLEQVGSRIRSEYLRRWLANPKSALPYTAMPVNFPQDQPLGQDLFPGSSREQLDAVMDLLLDYDGYLKRRTSIRKMIE